MTLFVASFSIFGISYGDIFFSFKQVQLIFQGKGFPFNPYNRKESKASLKVSKMTLLWICSVSLSNSVFCYFYSSFKHSNIFFSNSAYSSVVKIAWCENKESVELSNKDWD